MLHLRLVISSRDEWKLFSLAVKKVSKFFFFFANHACSLDSLISRHIIIDHYVIIMSSTGAKFSRGLRYIGTMLNQSGLDLPGFWKVACVGG